MMSLISLLMIVMAQAATTTATTITTTTIPEQSAVQNHRHTYDGFEPDKTDAIVLEAPIALIPISIPPHSPIIVQRQPEGTAQAQPQETIIALMGAIAIGIKTDQIHHDD